jgi:hypothetical protein
VGKVVDALPDTRMGRHIRGQLVRAEVRLRQITKKRAAPKSRGLWTGFTGWTGQDLQDGQE